MKSYRDGVYFPACYRTPEIQKQLTKAGGVFLMVLAAGKYIITECWQLISFKGMKKSTTRHRGVL